MVRPETLSNSGGNLAGAAVVSTQLSQPADVEELQKSKYRWKTGHPDLMNWVMTYFVGSELHYMFHHKSLR